MKFNQGKNTINISTFGSELFPYSYKYNTSTKEFTVEKIYLYQDHFDKKGKIIQHYEQLREAAKDNRNVVTGTRF